MSDPTPPTTVSTMPATVVSSLPSVASRPGGSQATGNNNGNRNNGRRNRNTNNNNNRQIVRTKTKFRGACDDLKGNVFQLFSESNDVQQFQITCDAISEYRKRTIQGQGDFDALLKPNFIKPEVPDPDRSMIRTAWMSPAQQKKLEDRIVMRYLDDVHQLQQNLVALYGVIIGQCSTKLKMKIKSLPDYEQHHGKSDCSWLLRTIHKIMMDFEETKYPIASLHEATVKFYTAKQEPNEDIGEYVKRVEPPWNTSAER